MNPDLDPAVIGDVVADTWATYLGTTADPCGTGGESGIAPTGERQVTAGIRIAGEAVWEVTLSGAWSAAEEATRRMLGSGPRLMEGSAGNPSRSELVMDAWGELVNTLAGNLKASLNFGAHSLSIPAVSVCEVVPPGTPPADAGGAREFPFEWDGYVTLIRIARITPA